MAPSRLALLRLLLKLCELLMLVKLESAAGGGSGAAGAGADTIATLVAIAEVGGGGMATTVFAEVEETKEEVLGRGEYVWWRCDEAREGKIGRDVSWNW